MKTVPKILMTILFIASAFLTAIYSQNKNLSDDEQGMEIIYDFQLEQDKQAVSEAMSGWWKKSMETNEERTAWFNEVKFGCFVHWGVYSDAAGEWNGKIVEGYAEHLMRKEMITLPIYKEKLVAEFNPVDFNADEWMRIAQEAGMKYFIITAKHHDGFAMYFSDAYPYDMRLTKYNRDPMMELKKAAEKYGIKFGFYYSHAFDWEHPDAPGNDWEYDNPGGDKLLHGRDWWLNYPQFLANAAKYVDEKSIPQIKELITKYKPDIIWFDTPHKLPLYENVRILKAIRETDPNIVVNGRLARFGDNNLGDYKNTGDRAAHFFPVEGLWESIPTTNESYGYSKHDKSHKSPGHFVRLLASATSRGGNILMNVGPMGNGKWDETDIKIFKTVGNWLNINGESIYGTERSPLPVQYWGEVTKKGNNIYLHVFDWPKNGKLIVGGLTADINKIYSLRDTSKKELSFNNLNQNDLVIDVPKVMPDSMNSVIVINTKGAVNSYPVSLLAHNQTNKLMVFDAQLNGKGFTYGDGKPNREYVTGWKKKEQSISWNFRLNEPAEFNISLNYNTARNDESGTVVLKINDQEIQLNYKPVLEREGSGRLQAGKIKLNAGEHTIQLIAGEYTGNELMRPLYITLTP